MNVGTHPIRPALYFYDKEGHLIAAESVVDIMGDLEIQEDGSLSIQTAMEPLGELTVSTHGRGELVSGSVRVAADEPIGGVLRFDLPGIGVARGWEPANPSGMSSSRCAAKREASTPGLRSTTWESSPEIVRCELMQGGTVLDDVSIPLAANGQSSWFIDAAFTAADTSASWGRYAAMRGDGDVHRRGPGAGCRQSHLHHTSGGAGPREDGSGIDAGSVPVLSGEHGRISHAASMRRLGSDR